jgi:hypothetical protein
MSDFIAQLRINYICNTDQDPALAKKNFRSEFRALELKYCIFVSGADPDPGSGAFLTPGSGIRNRFFPDPGSRIPDPGSQTHIFESLVTIFWVKNSIIL